MSNSSSAGSVKEIVVIGLGNPLMSDEGVGLHLLRILIDRQKQYPDVEFVDAGGSGMRALHAMARRRRAVFLDCAFMGEKPGTLRRFRPEEVASKKILPRLSLHEGDLLDTIALSRKLGECPPEIVIFGIEPGSIGPGETLSATLKEQMNEYAGIIGKSLLG